MNAPRRRMRFGLLLLCLWICPFLQAQTQAVQKQDPVIVTVSGEPVGLHETSASVTVVTREQIQQSHAKVLTDLLRQLPFVHVSQPGASGGLTTATIRGGDPNFTLVLIDGSPVNDLSNILGGSFDFSQLSVDNIERIEIVRGPLSSLYGSEAISGVINIITRSHAGPLQANVEAGNLNAFKAGMEGGGKFQSMEYTFGGSYNNGAKTDAQKSEHLTTLTGRSTRQWGETRDLDLTAHWSASDSAHFPENGGGPLFSFSPDLKTSNRKSLVAGLRFHQTIAPSWKLQIVADFFANHDVAFTPALLDAPDPHPDRSQPSIQTDSHFRRSRVELANLWEKKGWNAVVSLSATRETGTNDSLIAGFLPSAFDLDRNTEAIAAEVNYTRPSWQINSGFRIDSSTGFATEFSRRAGFSYLPGGGATRFRATYGEGFKLPSFYALGEPNVGNPELVPERSRGMDAGVEQQIGNIILGATYFRNTFDHLIDFSPEQFRLVNRREARTDGVELEARLPLFRSWEISSFLGYLHWKLTGTDEPLRDRPRWRGGFQIHWTPDSTTSVIANFEAVGERFDFQVPVPDRNIAAGYRVLTASVERSFGSKFTGYVRAQNLLNAHFQEFVGFPDPGIAIQLGLIFRRVP